VDQEGLTRRLQFCGALLSLTLGACSHPGEADIRQALENQTSGVIRLPQGEIEISSELRVKPGSRELEIAGNGTVLKASPNFKGRAMLVIERAKNVTLRDVAFDGNREALAKPFDAAPPENAFRIWYQHNGILADEVEGLEIFRVNLSNVVHFPVLISRSKAIRIREVAVASSGNKNQQGRNNLSGGILIEEGSSDFEVRNSTFREIWGNGLWTHSLFTSPRQSAGRFTENRFETIGRDALLVGHATMMRVERNKGVQIGFPENVVDVENGGIPVTIDTAGDVDQSEYLDNVFEEVNGKCIDLDGFHDGTVRGNSCTNRLGATAYPHGHYGIVMNNTFPTVHSNNIEIRGNTIDGAKYGGMFVMGSGNRIVANRFINLNLAGCNESGAAFNCLYNPREPELLETGIYLGRGVARTEETRANEIRDNEVTGHQMKARCVASGPGVDRSANVIANNTCADAASRP
jgi:hypothetical protein